MNDTVPRCTCCLCVDPLHTNVLAVVVALAPLAFCFGWWLGAFVNGTPIGR